MRPHAFTGNSRDGAANLRGGIAVETVFTFLTPLFGVGFGVLLLNERLSWTFGLAALLVVAGIALVNLPARKD